MSKNGRELPSRERGPPFYVAVNHVAVNHVTPVIKVEGHTVYSKALNQSSKSRSLFERLN